MKNIPLIACALFFSQSCFAQTTTEYFHVLSGTGFFVNREYIITNAHVVKGCNKVTIKGAGNAEHEVEVKVSDAERDLALLETDVPPEQFAPLRFNIEDLHAGDKVYVIGYPGEEGAHGTTKFAQATMQAIAGEVPGDGGHFYISDVVEHGNSGGPVFDTSGNVIGVVVAKTVLTATNVDTKEVISEQHVGVAITLDTLKQFLFDHGVFVQWTSSGLLQFADHYLEEQTKHYIVNVQCRLPGQNPAPGNENTNNNTQ